MPQYCVDRKPAILPCTGGSPPPFTAGWQGFLLVSFLFLGASLRDRAMAADLGRCDEMALRAAVETGGEFTTSCQTIVLTEPLVIRKDTSIAATAVLRLSATSLFPLFVIQPGVTLSLTRVNMGEYDASPASPIGRAIYNDGGSFLATNCRFRSAAGTGGADAGWGGAIFSRNGLIRLDRCALERNRAAAQGGAIFATNSSVTLLQCAFRENSVSGAPAGAGPSSGGALSLVHSGSTIIGCEFTGNQVTSSLNDPSDTFGGAIAQTSGDLTISTTTLTANTAHAASPRAAAKSRGGALSSSGTLSVRNSTFTSNACLSAVGTSLSDEAWGGAVWSSGKLELHASKLVANSSKGSSARGGALANEGTAALEGCFFSFNSLEAYRSAQGGALLNRGAIALSLTSFHTNRADALPSSAPLAVIASGGALHNSGQCTATNITLTQNSVYARSSGDPLVPAASAYGGAVYNERGTGTWVHATVAFNRCEKDFFDARTTLQGAGVFLDSGVTLLMNTAVANNSPGGNCFGSVWDGGGNACSDGTCPFITGFRGQPIQFEAQTGPNGTLTPTPRSVLIDGANSSPVAAQDQAGHRRPVGSRSDIGAVEWVSSGATQWTRFLRSGPRVLEKEKEVIITVQHAGHVSGTVRVNFETRDGTAEDGTDYLGTRGQLSFPVGRTLGSFSIRILADSLPEAPERIRLLLTDPETGAVLAEDEVTILEAESEFRAVARRPETIEGQPLLIDIFRQGSVAETAGVNYRTVDGTARAGEDYLFSQGTLLFGPGETHRLVSIHTFEDDLRENSEDLTFELSTPGTGAELARTPVVLRDELTCDLDWLQAAVDQGGLVRFACDYTFALARTLVITRDTILDASGHEVVLDGGDRIRLIEVRPGVALSLTNLILARGRQVGQLGVEGGRGEDALGAAIFSDSGVVRASQCRFVMNSVQGGAGGVSSRADLPIPGGHALGAAVFCRGGTLDLASCQFLTNNALGGAGGLNPHSFPAPAPGGYAQGGGLYATNAFLRMQDCHFAWNGCLAGRGGNQGSSDYSEYGVSQGGALYCVGGEALIQDSSFRGNQTKSGEPASGGAIHQEGGQLKLARTRVEENRAEGAMERVLYGVGSSGIGGGIWSQGNLDLVECTIRGNTALSRGVDSAAGGVYANAVARMDRCYFESNTALSTLKGYNPKCCSQHRFGRGFGGGLLNTNTLILLNSTFVENVAQGGLSEFWPTPYVLGSNAYGGALLNQGRCYATNNTFTHNQAQGGPVNGGDGFGGGICNLSGELILSHATLAGNRARGGETNEVQGTFPGRGFGSQIFNASSGLVTLANTILADDRTSTNCVGVVQDAGGNLSSDHSCLFTSGLNGIAPRLGPLAFFGGPIPLLALLPGSPAIDAGHAPSCAEADQRGFSRPFGLQCDIGAFEARDELAAETLFQERADESHVRLIYVGATGSTRTLQSSTDLDHWIPWGLDLSVGDQGWFDTVVPVQPSDTLRAFRVVAP